MKLAIASMLFILSVGFLLLFSPPSKSIEAESVRPPKILQEIRPPKLACSMLASEAVILITAQSLGAPKDKMTQKIMEKLTEDKASNDVKGWYVYMVNFIFSNAGTEVEKLRKFIANCTSIET